jgi:predicted RNA methylase
MKLKDLEWELESLKPFENPKLHLEQYATDAHIAGIYLYNDILNGSAHDLYC